MPKRYPPEVKEKFLSVIREDRAAEKPWTEILEAVKAIGYNGGLAALQAMVSASRKAEKRTDAPAEVPAEASAAAPAEVPAEASAEAPAAAGAKRARRNMTTGEIILQKRGVIPTGWEVGCVDATGVFTASQPAKRAKARRRRTSSPKAPRVVAAPAAPAAAPKSGGLSEIEVIVQREVVARLKAAKEAAVKAFDEALGL